MVPGVGNEQLLMGMKKTTREEVFIQKDNNWMYQVIRNIKQGERHKAEVDWGPFHFNSNESLVIIP